jgi:hypothetical protein
VATETSQPKESAGAKSGKSPAGIVGPHGPPRHHQSFWLWVMCLTGVDYFSTLGYQPSIAFEATGLLSPLATIFLVLMTLCGAVPVYRHVAGSSPHGQGSIAMLERLVHGWKGKLLVLVLLGFAATDFVITKTLSAADAAEHLIHNPFWKETPPLLHHQMLVTMVLLISLGAMFLRGFREVMGLAVVIVGGYLLINVVLIASGLYYLATHPETLSQWYANVTAGQWHLSHRPLEGHSWVTIILLCLLFFPKLALGLSGFETGVAVMGLIRSEGATPEEKLQARIRDARKLLLTAALIMSVLLLGSAFITATLIDPAELRAPVGDEVGGKAANRALAYLAHGEGAQPISPLFGNVFGTIYDIATVVILWFAGASAMSGLLNLVPQYLPRYGMAPDWARAVRPLVLLFTAINLLVTWIFGASVAAQGDAYATGVVVLMASASVATVIEIWRERKGKGWRRLHLGFSLVTFVFLYTTAAIIIEKPAGMKIAACFIASVVVLSFVSRTARSTELRFTGFRFKDDHSKFLWDSMRHIEFPILVPHRPGRRDLEAKESSMREEHHLEGDIPLVFIEAERGDVSEFLQSPVMEVTEREGRITLRVTGCASIAHVIAAVALELSKVGKPPEIHFGWSDETPLAANLSFVLFGEGNVPWMVRELILKAESNPERQPRVVVG